MGGGIVNADPGEQDDEVVEVEQEGNGCDGGRGAAAAWDADAAEQDEVVEDGS